jgi:hypothetical protein
MSTPLTAAAVQSMEVAKLQASLTTKIQRLHLFKAPMSAPIPEAITGMSSDTVPVVELLELDTADGWVDMGLIGSDDAPTWARDMDTEDLLAIGFRDAVRTEITSDVANLTATFLEKNRHVIETYDNIDLSGVTPDPDTGEVKWIRPSDAPLIKSRYAAYGQDGSGADRVWMVKILTAGVIDSVDDQTWGGEGFLTWPVTLKGLVDTEVGTSMITYMGGPGVKANLAAMGFDTTP